MSNNQSINPLLDAATRKRLLAVCEASSKPRQPGDISVTDAAFKRDMAARNPDTGYAAALRLVGEQAMTIKALLALLHDSWDDAWRGKDRRITDALEPDWLALARERAEKGGER